AGAEALLGQTPAAVRAVPALMGTMAAGIAYLAGGLLWGRWGAVSAGLFFALARWDINFSRIGMQGESTPLFAMSALVLALLAVAEALLGQTPAAVRAVPALMGTMAAGIAYLAGGLLWGRWGAVSAGLFFALARWDINFSRIGMQGESTPLFAMSALVLALLA